LIEEARSRLPELPAAKRERFQHEFELSAYEARVLTQSREMATFYQDLVDHLHGGHKLAASWVIGELSAALNRAGLEINQSPVSSDRLAGLLQRVRDDTISGRTAKEVFDAMWNGGMEADVVIQTQGLSQISDAGEIEKIVDAIIGANPAQVAEYRAGKEKAFNFFVGQAMKATKGKANPSQVNEILKKKLAP
jgi:aspartyl-tRNA(Asn)/glutamyl-tRNA(Gln) amidotransferase subunit B